MGNAAGDAYENAGVAYDHTAGNKEGAFYQDSSAGGRNDAYSGASRYDRSEEDLQHRATLNERARRDQGRDQYDKRLDSLQEVLSQRVGAPIYQAAVMTEDGYGNVDEDDDTNIAFFRLLYQMMLENEVDEKYADALIDDLAENVKPNTPLDHLLAIVYQRLVLKFGEAETISPAGKGPKVIFFIGPTGVGKTTTIAKLADFAENNGLTLFDVISSEETLSQIPGITARVKK
ncbi:MAG: hypothetical protein IK078_03140, partial [Lachnospiraceae bacterium]|nr:hypothetical protein [Lachnospiraceae bacterium]